MFGILAVLTLLFVCYATTLVYETTLIMAMQLGYENYSSLATIVAILFGLVIVVAFIATWLRDKLEKAQRDNIGQNLENKYIDK